MSYGLQVENPSGVLVMSSDRGGYTYAGAPTLVTAGFVSTAGVSKEFRPYRYSVTLPSVTHVPLVACELSATAIVAMGGVTRVGATAQWTIDVYSCAVAGRTGASIVPVAPTIHIFAVGASGEAWGMRLYDTAGNVMLDLTRPPLWMREVLDFPARSGQNVIGVASGDWAHQDGDSLAMSTSSGKIAVMGGRWGEQVEFNNASGETFDYWHYGWVKNGASLERKLFWGGDDKTTQNGDSYAYNLYPTKVIILYSDGLP